ncbi:hypothetical protein DFP72DRAFT_434535 [Ephemerocybe angulata]|uniref:Uncharacterized protein n=1 Tax=Ephemerocybe angulata TaxID=980116 RepID=A0A8H6HVD7_9AGAR|nr:hypothetical protein DFP72DRAFT_434535 [Tulosesus angulatus]
MPRSSSLSSSGTPSPSSSPKLLGSFDPFAVHPFTNYSGPSKSKHTSGHSNHVLPHPSALSLDGPAPGLGPHSSTGYPAYPSGSSHSYYNPNGNLHQPSPVPAGYQCQASQTHQHGGAHGHAGPKPIFVPFRQETSSPELSDVLRRKRMGL